MEVKRPGRKSDHSAPSGAGVNDEATPVPPTYGVGNKNLTVTNLAGHVTRTEETRNRQRV